MFRLAIILVLLPCILSGQDKLRHPLLITEFLPDPQPVIGLPAHEFIELTNFSEHSIDLLGWRIADQSSETSIKKSFLLEPGESVIICQTAAAPYYEFFGKTLGISGLPSINNESDQLILRDPEGRIIHALQYDISWFGNKIKAEGGWSLELVDPANSCQGLESWKPSTNSSGGTPGRKNAVYNANPDKGRPFLNGVFVQGRRELQFYFNEGLDSSSIEMLDFRLDGKPVPGLRYSLEPPFFSKLIIFIPEDLAAGKFYRFSLSGLKDCAGNAIFPESDGTLGLPEAPIAGEIIINEILFHPRPGGADYIELFHQGKTAVDLSRIFISNGQQFRSLANEPKLLFPGAYLAITTNSRNVRDNYPVKFDGSLVELSTLPGFPDKSGKVFVLDDQENILDQLIYDEKWHSPLVKNPEGVALERIDQKGASQNPGNWNSASSAAGFGTPGYRNSHYVDGSLSSGSLTVQPPVFSPDGDGFEDIVRISYKMETSSTYGEIAIYDSRGIFTHQLYMHGMLGLEGSRYWNGFLSSGNPAKPGLYIVILKAFDANGKTRKVIKPLVLTGKK